MCRPPDPLLAEFIIVSTKIWLSASKYAGTIIFDVAEPAKLESITLAIMRAPLLLAGVYKLELLKLLLETRIWVWRGRDPDVKIVSFASLNSELVLAENADTKVVPSKASDPRMRFCPEI